MLKSILAIGLAFFCLNSISAQPIVHRLMPGDRLPTAVYKKLAADLAIQNKIRGKRPQLILIDFWSTSCSICLASMPKLDSIQKSFGGKVSIILVTRNSDAEVKRMFSHITIKKPNLPMVNSDRLYYTYFPHAAVPHHVWIDENLVVRYISDGYNATYENIEQFLAGNDIKLHFKQDEEDFDFYQPFLAYKSGELTRNIQKYSALIRKVEQFGGGASGLIYDTVFKQRGVKLINTTLIELYKTAYGEAIGGGRFAADNLVKLDVTDPSAFKFPLTNEGLDEWESHNLYGYELRMSSVDYKKVFEAMRWDLAATLPYSASVEKIETVSYVLTQVSSTDQLQTKNPAGPPVRSSYTFRNVPFLEVLKRLEFLCNYLKYPFATEFNYDGNVDFDLLESETQQPPTIEWLRKSLKKYGLELIEKKVLQEVLIIHNS